MSPNKTRLGKGIFTGRTISVKGAKDHQTGSANSGGGYRYGIKFGGVECILRLKRATMGQIHPNSCYRWDNNFGSSHLQGLNGVGKKSRRWEYYVSPAR
jgi:hypothetical protein